MSLPTPALIAIGVALYYGGLWFYSNKRGNGSRLPPGPKGWPIVGNLFQIPKDEPWLAYADWAKIYGPVISTTALGVKTIILNSGKAATDLLDGRATIYSDRPKFTGKGRPSVFSTGYADPRFKSVRRLLTTGLNAKASKSYRPIQMEETQVFLNSLLNTPDDFGAHARRNAVAVILKIGYGISVGGNDDPLVVSLEENFRIMAQFGRSRWIPVMGLLRQLKRPTPTSTTVTPPPEQKTYTMASFSSPACQSRSTGTWFDYLPSWGPIAFIRAAQAARAQIIASERVPFYTAKEQIAKGEYVASFASKHLIPEDGSVVDPETEDDILHTSAALYVGGGDTTVSALTTFFLVMAQHPDIQKRAQAEVDSVAINRLPTLDDYESMPYVRALIKEVVRWAPVAPLGLSHSVMEDDVYEHLFIPKGTRIVANIWAITHDEELYPEPHNFDPSRHLGAKHQADPWKYVFGYGRRSCPGAHLAEMSLFLNISNVLSVFNISKKIDGNGKEVEPEVHWNTGVTMHLKHFEVSIKPRSPEKLTLLE